MYVTYALIVALIVLNVADVYTTYQLLKAGGSELNKAVAWLIAKCGLVAGLVASKLPVVPLVVLSVYEETVIGQVMLGVLCACAGWVVWHNYREIK